MKLKKVLVITVVISLMGGCLSPIEVFETDDTNDNNRHNNNTSTITKTNSGTSDYDNKTNSSNQSKIKENSTPENRTDKETEPSENTTSLSKKTKYDYFRSNLTDSIRDTQIVNSSINPHNDSMNITYQIDKSNLNKTNNRTLEVIRSYAIMVDLYVDSDDYPTLDDSWVPKYINVTAVSANGTIYYTGYLKYEWAYKWKVSEDWKGDEYDRYKRYVLEFFNTTDRGPAHPDYEEDPYDK